MSSSVTLPVVDLSAAVVGTSNSVPWDAGTNQSSNRRAHLSLYNESGCALQITLADGASFYLPAGGWQMIELEPSTRSLQYTVLHVMPNAQVTKLFITWYPPDATSYAAPRVPILGNSPIGGTVANTVANVLQGAGQSNSLTEQDIAVVAGQPSNTALLPTINNSILTLAARNNLGNRVNGVAINTDGSLTFSGPFLNALGAFIQYNGITTVAQGVPPIVAAILDFQTTTTGLKTVLTFTVGTANGLFRINWSAKVANAVSGNNITAQVAFTDTSNTAQTKNLNAATGGGATNTQGFIGSNSIVNGWYPGLSEMIGCKAGTTITISYNDPTNTPNDFISAVIEQLL